MGTDDACWTDDDVYCSDSELRSIIVEHAGAHSAEFWRTHCLPELVKDPRKAELLQRMVARIYYFGDPEE